MTKSGTAKKQKTFEKDNEQSKIDNNKSARYVFPLSGKKCPRCRGTNTEAYKTKDNIQYRRCRAPVCRKNYSVRATGKKQKDK